MTKIMEQNGCWWCFWCCMGKFLISKIMNEENTSNLQLCQSLHLCAQTTTRQVAVYPETYCSIGSKRAFPTGVLDKWHNCLLIYCLLIYWRNVAQLQRPHRFVYFCITTQQDVHGDSQRMRKNCVGTFLVRNVSPAERLCIDSNGKNGN